MARCLNCMNEYDGYKEVCPVCGFAIGTPPKEVFHLYPGTEIGGRYIIGTVIGFGGFGIVYRAWDNLFQTVVAVKEYFPVDMVDRQPNEKEVNLSSEKCRADFTIGKERFIDEARIMAKFNTHDNIVKIFDCFEENNTGYIIMELLEGKTLKQLLKSSDKPLEVDYGIKITVSMCDILHVVHKEKVVHRDISPDNIFICTDGKIKLLDFGAARLPNIKPNLTKILKRGYAPPEQYSDDKAQGSWTDVYALGATLYRMLTGKVPYESVERDRSDKMPRPKELNSDIPDYVDRTIMRAMALNSSLRYQNMQEFKQALSGMKGAIDEEQELKRRKRKRLISVACVFMILAVGAGFVANKYLSKKELAELPNSTITMWIPTDSTDDTGDIDSVMEEFNKNYGEHVEVKIEEISTDEYSDKLKNAEGTDSMPTMFLVSKYDAELESCLKDISDFTNNINDDEYLFSKQVKKIIKEKNMMPMGFDMHVLYVNKNVYKDSVTVDSSLLNIENIENFNKFYNGETGLYIGSTKFYHELMNNKKIASYIEIYDVTDINSDAHFKDYWCVSNTADNKQKICAEAIMRYMIKENCQRLFYTVDSTRLSDSIPLNKEVFNVNYYKNTVEDKMEFLTDSIKNLVIGV